MGKNYSIFGKGFISGQDFTGFRDFVIVSRDFPGIPGVNFLGFVKAEFEIPRFGIRDR